MLSEGGEGLRKRGGNRRVKRLNIIEEGGVNGVDKKILCQG